MGNKGQKIGLILLTTLGMNIISYINNTPPTMAQKLLDNDRFICRGNFPNGAVKCVSKDGEYFVGNVRNGQPEGQGIFVYAGGNRYEGQFRDGTYNGSGIFIFPKDENRYEGIFRNGLFIKGKLIFDGNVYEGEFEPLPISQVNAIVSTPQGKGVFTFANGARYEGEFFFGQIRGQGVLKFKDGTRCEGQFFGNDLNGKATCIFRNGLRYEGELRNGRPDGVGVLIEPNGKKTSGVFRAGEMLDLNQFPRK